MTPEIRESEIKGFIRLQKEQGGIVPSKVKGGTTLLIETSQYMYEIKALDMPVGRRYILTTGAPICRNEHVVIGVKAHWKEVKYEMPDWIGKGMCMVMSFASGTTVLTGEVKGLTLTSKGKDGKPFSYNFWDE